MVFSPDGATLAAGGDSICLWDLKADDNSSSSSLIIEANGGDMFALAYSPNGTFLASSDGYSVKIWRASGGSLQTGLGGHSIFSVSFSPNGKLIASGDLRGCVELWKIDDGHFSYLAVSPYAHRYDDDDNDHDEDYDDYDDDNEVCVNSVAFTPNGQNLASGGEDGTIFLWDTGDS